MDQTYRNLLIHLQTSTKSLHKGVPPTLAHYLSALPLPLPTTLTASAIGSLAWTPSNSVLLLSAFRHAVHQKVDSLVTPAPSTSAGAGPSTTGSSSIFSLSPGPSWALRKWVHALCSGARNGQAFVRVAALGGLLLGLEDVKDRLDAGGARWKVEDEVVVAFAEYLDGLNDSWAIEVPKQGERTDREEIIYIASYVLPLVSEKKFRVLDLAHIIDQCTIIIQSVFQDSRFLQSESKNSDEPYSETVNTRLPRIARLTSRAIDVLSDNPTDQRLGPLHDRLQRTTSVFSNVAKEVENGWERHELDSASGDAGVSASEKTAWTHLKALLFTTVMVLQSVVDSVLYNAFPSNPSLASQVLETFLHLSFISTKFGGVLARGETSFREYQRAFYTALDIVAASPPHGDELVLRLGNQVEDSANKEAGSGQAHVIQQARTAFYLAVVEQLADQISVDILLVHVLPICRRYLGKPQEREVFESSHSVVLALFASLGRQQQRGGPQGDSRREEVLRSIVPFYASSLIDCSADGMLNTTQLRLAFSSLVTGASSSSLPISGDNRDTASAALAWYCIECLLSEINTKHQRGQKQEANPSEDQYERLVLTLVSLIAAIPSSPSLAPLLPRVLHEVEKIVMSEENTERRQAVVKAVYEETLRSVGDETKEIVLKWWFEALGVMVRHM